MKNLSATAFTGMAWLGLIAAGTSASLVHADDPFTGHRLFFTEAQRTGATVKDLDARDGSLPDASVQETAVTGEKRDSGIGEDARASSANLLRSRQGHDSTPREKGFTNPYQVYFTGLVTGLREARVLVNGLPCEAAGSEQTVKADRSVLISCHGVRDDGLRLSLSIATEELLVTDKAGRVHYLLPGEGM